MDMKPGNMPMTIMAFISRVRPWKRWRLRMKEVISTISVFRTQLMDATKKVFSHHRAKGRGPSSLKRFR